MGVCTQLHFHPDGVKLHIQDETIKLKGRRISEEGGPAIRKEKDPTQLGSEPGRTGTAEIIVWSGHPENTDRACMEVKPKKAKERG